MNYVIITEDTLESDRSSVWNAATVVRMRLTCVYINEYTQENVRISVHNATIKALDQLTYVATSCERILVKNPTNVQNAIIKLQTKVTYVDICEGILENGPTCVLNADTEVLTRRHCAITRGRIPEKNPTSVRTVITAL